MPQPGPQIIRITDPGDPRLADYANIKDRHLAGMARTASDGSSDGLFMAEGELVVRQLIASGLSIRSILLTETRLETVGDALETIAPSIPVYLVSQSFMSDTVGFHIHRGILATGFRPPARSAASLLSQARTLVILEDLANHDNVGGIFRTAAALGGLRQTAVLLSPRCCDPLYRKAIRVSMGTALRVPFAVVEPWPGVLSQIAAAGFSIIALTPDAGANDIARVLLPSKVALLLGAEGPGLNPEASSYATRVRIPIDPGVDSLNVVTAAGIALHRLARPQ
jgi:tRNA G18 (ribose-2'-O)-methylase SpoU